MVPGLDTGQVLEENTALRGIGTTDMLQKYHVFRESGRGGGR